MNLMQKVCKKGIKIELYTEIMLALQYTDSLPVWIVSEYLSGWKSLRLKNNKHQYNLTGSVNKNHRRQWTTVSKDKQTRPQAYDQPGIGVIV